MMTKLILLFILLFQFSILRADFVAKVYKYEPLPLLVGKYMKVSTQFKFLNTYKYANWTFFYTYLDYKNDFAYNKLIINIEDFKVYRTGGHDNYISIYAINQKDSTKVCCSEIELCGWEVVRDTSITQIVYGYEIEKLDQSKKVFVLNKVQAIYYYKNETKKIVKFEIPPINYKPTIPDDYKHWTHFIIPIISLLFLILFFSFRKYKLSI